MNVFHNIMHNSCVNFTIYVGPLQAADVWVKMIHDAEITGLYEGKSLQEAL